MGPASLCSGANERNFKAIILSVCLCASSPFVLSDRVLAQQPAEDQTISNSELAQDNLDRVAASESQITAVLNANPGLFVELKRWIAKDAADRGQIVKDSDLTDSAILCASRSRMMSDSEPLRRACYKAMAICCPRQIPIPKWAVSRRRWNRSEFRNS